MSKIYVLYHDSCLDGLGAKYAAWKKFGDAAEYIPVQYGKPLPELKTHKWSDELKVGDEIYPLDKVPGPAYYRIPVEVYIVDFSYPKNVLEELRARVDTLVVLDHHKTAEEALRGFPGAHFDMNKSGAVLAWEYFHPGIPVPLLLLNIQDRDLWKFELANTDEITAALPLLRGNMEYWDSIVKDNDGYLNLAMDGSVLIEYDELQVENALKDVVVLPFKGYKAGVRNWTGNASNLGEAIYKSRELGVDFSLTYFIGSDGRPVFSFRSQGDMDVSKLAKELGGGGHKNASGCPTTMAVLADLLAGKL